MLGLLGSSVYKEECTQLHITIGCFSILLKVQQHLDVLLDLRDCNFVRLTITNYF